MSKENNLTDFLTGVANAIRTKKGTTGTINPQNFESEIESISSGKTETAPTVTLNLASGNQVVTPETGQVFSQVTITKPSTLLASNIKKDVNIAGVVGTFNGSIHWANVIMAVYLKESCSVVWHSAEDNSYSSNDKIFVDDAGNRYTANEVDCYYAYNFSGVLTKMTNGTTYTVPAYYKIIWKTKNTASPVYPCSYYYYYEPDVTDDYTELKVTGKNIIQTDIVPLKEDMYVDGMTGNQEIGIINSYANSKNVTQLRFALYRQD